MHRGVDYRSPTTLFGLPLLHVASGIDPATGKQRVAKGIIAVGGVAKGVVAIGGVAMGGFAFGGLAVGGVAFGGCALGMFAFGGLAIALIGALGGGAIAPIAIGGGALGYLTYGGGTIGVHALDAMTHDPVAERFFLPWAKWVMANLQWINGAALVTIVGIGVGLPLWLQRRPSVGGGSSESQKFPTTSFAIAATFGGTMLLGLLCELLLGHVKGGWLIAIFVLLLIASALAAFLLRRFAGPELQRVFRVAGAWLAFLGALPMIGFAAFFVLAMLSERGGWNPAVDEGIIVPLIWLGAVLLPVSGCRLFRGVGRGIGCAVVVIVAVASVAIGVWNHSVARLRVERERARAVAQSEAVREALLHQSQSHATNRAIFGPVLERTLPISELGYSYSLNLDSDLMQVMPANMTRTDWSSGVTLPDGVIVVAAGEGKPVMVAGTSTQLEPVRNGVAAWENMRAEGIRISYELEKGQTVTVSGETNSLPLTFAFRTQTGTSGLLQVTSFTDKPRGVKVRYKLVQNAIPPSKQKLNRSASPAEDFPAGSLWVGGLGFPQVLDLYAELTQSELDVEPRVRGLTAIIGYTNTTALKRAEVITQFERALRDQAGVVVKHIADDRIAVRYGGLEFRWVVTEGDTTSKAEWLSDASDTTGQRQVQVLEDVLLDESAVASAELVANQPEQKSISVRLTASGADRLAEVTRANVGRQLAIVWRDHVVMSPQIVAPITGGAFTLTGRMSDAEAKQLLAALNHRPGARPASECHAAPAATLGLRSRRWNECGSQPSARRVASQLGRAVA